MKTLQTIDYSPLSTDRMSSWKAMREVFRIPSWLTISIVALFSLAAMIATFSFIFALMLPVILTVIVSSKVSMMRQKAWIDFAKVNGWQVIPSKVVPSSYLPPSIANIGHTRTIGDLVRVEFENHTCDAFTYSFRTGSGKHAKTHFFSVVGVSLASNFPHLILDSKHTFSLLEITSNMKKVSLEGDFDKYFSLSYQQGQQIDALSVITPDIMSTLIKSNQDQDIEIVGNRLFFIVSYELRTFLALPKLLEAVDKFADQIDHRAKTINFKSNGSESLVAANLPTLPAVTPEDFASLLKISRPFKVIVGLLLLMIGFLYVNFLFIALGKFV